MRCLAVTALTALLLLAMAACGRAEQETAIPAWSPGKAAIDEAAALAGEYPAEFGFPGMTLVAMHQDDVLLAAGYGVPELRAGVPVTPATVFQLGSISKQFLAAVILQLAEEDRLSLDDAVAQHLADFSHLPESLTIRHLLNHTSGLREQFVLPEAEEGYRNLERTTAELRAALQRAPVDFPPGTRWSYSNTGYTLLAFIVEALTSQPYHHALGERLFAPLGLDSMGHCPSLPTGPAEARGHILDGGALAASPPENMNWAWGDGGLCGNALDLARWTRMLHAGDVLAAKSRREMLTMTRLASGRAADYGFALSLVEMDGEAKMSHNGAMFGFSGSAAYYPAYDLTVVALTNRGDVRTEVIERRVARRLLGLPEPVHHAPRLSAEALAALVGRYDIGVFDIEILQDGAELRLEVPPPGPRTVLHHIGGREFAGEAGADAYRVLFPPGTAPPEELRLFMAGMHWYGVRVSP
jgi:D-alanyl-D-alanine carboxypeptidase